MFMLTKKTKNRMKAPDIIMKMLKFIQINNIPSNKFAIYVNFCFLEGELIDKRTFI